jgi:hypothetical protein
LLVALAALLVGPASAQAVELGEGDRSAEASCPKRCQALGRVSGYQLKLEGRTSPFKVDRDGRITAFTLTLGKPTARQQRFFTQTFGGPPGARLAILRRGTKRIHRLVAESPVFDLTPYFGSEHRFRLRRPLAVKKGYIVALTVPTWAPAFAVGLSDDEGWRSSRTAGRCSDVRQRAAQQRVGGLRTYGCFYRTSRMLYTATFEPVDGQRTPDDADRERGSGGDRDSDRDPSDSPTGRR